MRIKIDEDTKTSHITTGKDVALCGLPPNYTDQKPPQKRKYGITCEGCQYEIIEIKKLKSKF